jgi:phosphoglycolate phosphatase-like HAD superfamily hydrolase
MDAFIKPAAVIDVDGVLYNYVGRLADVAARHLGRPLSDFPPAQVWNFFSDQWGMTLQEYLALVDIGVERYDFIRIGDPFDGAIEGINQLLDLGVEVHIATDMGEDGDPKGHRRARLEWLTGQGFDLNTLPVTFTPDKHEVALEYLAQGYQVFALEDKVANYHLLNEAGATCYLLNQNWNRHEPSAHRVSTVLEFAEAVEVAVAATIS